MDKISLLKVSTKNPPGYREDFLWIRLFYELYDRFEYLRIWYSEIREDLTIQHHTLCIERMDKSRVVHTEWTYSIIDTDVPEATEVSLLCLTTDVGICTCFHDRIFRARIDVSIHSAISLCESEDTFMSFVCHYTTFYTSHRREFRE